MTLGADRIWNWRLFCSNSRFAKEKLFMPPSNFSTLDWVIVGLYLTGTVAIGLYVNRYIRGMSDFLVAGRSLRTHLGVATMVGSELGLVTAMYAAQKGFTGGFAAFHIGVLAGVACLVVGFTGMIVGPLRELQVMTIPEYYQLRFNSWKLRVAGGILLALGGILNMGMFLKAGSLFVTGLTGMNDPQSINVVMTVMILLVLAYTTLGGMVSVVLTDYIQFVVLSFGLLLCCAIAFFKLGWGNLVESVEAVHGTAGFDPLNDDVFGGSYVAWMFFLGLISCNVWQTAVMRACAAESTAVVRRLYMWSSIGFVIRTLIPQFIGIGALAYLWNDEALRAVFFTPDGAINDETSLSAMPVFLSQLLPIGVIGLVGSGMLAAFMSTHDTYLLCWASVLVEDVINPLSENVGGASLSQKQRILTTRILLFVIAAFLLIWSMYVPLGQELWEYMIVSGAIYFVGAFAVLTCGIYWSGSSRFGAWTALILGGSNLFGLDVIQKQIRVGDGTLADWTAAHGISEADFGLTTCALALIGMVVGSLLVPDKTADKRIRIATLVGMVAICISAYFWWTRNLAAFWGTILAIVLSLYGLLSIIVSIGGWRDVLAMFKSLDEQHGADHES